MNLNRKNWVCNERARARFAVPLFDAIFFVTRYLVKRFLFPSEQFVAEMLVRKNGNNKQHILSKTSAIILLQP